MSYSGRGKLVLLNGNFGYYLVNIGHLGINFGY